MEKDKKTNRRNFLSLAISFFVIISILAGCAGTKQEIAGETSAYVYVPRQLVTSSTGGYKLPSAFSNPIVADGYLYYMDRGFYVQTVGKAVLQEEDGIVGIDGAEEIVKLSVSATEVEENGSDREPGEEEILELLDLAIEAGTAYTGEQENKEAYVDVEKEYISFSIMDYAVDQEQNVYLILDYSRGNYYAMESKGTILCRRTAEGEWVYRHYFPGLAPLYDSLAVDGSGGIYMLTAEGIFAVDGNGREAGIVDTEVYKGSSYSSERLLGDLDGHVYYFVFEEFDMIWRGMEVGDGRGTGLTELSGLSGRDWMDTCTVFRGNVFYSVSGIFQMYDRDSLGSSELMPWANSNLLGDYIRAAVPLEEDRLLVWYGEPDMEGLYLLVRTSAKELPEREAVVLSAFGGSTQLGDAVIRFNRLNEKYQVVLEDHGYSNGTAEGARTRQDTALASADPPDLISLEGRDLAMDMEKGLLEDLFPYLEGSSVLDKADFLENVLEGYTVNGSLVGIPKRFVVEAVAGRSSQAGGLESWTMEDVYALVEQYPEQTKLLNNALYRADTGKSDTRVETRAHLLGTFCAPWYLEKFVDWERGVCSFDSADFGRFLDWVGEHSIESGEKIVSGQSTFYLQGYLSEDALLMEGRIDFQDAAVWEVQFGEEIVLLGYPTVDGKGTAGISVEAPLGIVKGAGNKKGAWEFLEYYISSEMDSMRVSGLPTSRAQLQVLMEKAVKSDEIGGVPKAKYFPELDGETVEIYATSHEMAEKLMAFLEAADFTPVSRLRQMVAAIVLEESALYYTGDKSLDEVVTVIQNRVQLLLDEDG